MERRGFLKTAAAACGSMAALLYGGIAPDALAAAKSPKPSQFHVVTLSGRGLADAVAKALETDSAQALVARLSELGFTRQPREYGVRFEYPTSPELSGAMVRIPFVDPAGAIAYVVGGMSDSGAFTTSIGGLLEGSENAPTGARILEVRSGVATFTESVAIGPDGVVIRDELTGASSFVPAPTSSPGVSQGVTPMGYWSCDPTCINVAGFLYGMGCSVGTFFMCLACIVFTGPGAIICGVLCAMFGYVVCVTAQANNAPELCRLAGYCTYHS